jgi:hypothetical protein
MNWLVTHRNDSPPTNTKKEGGREEEKEEYGHSVMCPISVLQESNLKKLDQKGYSNISYLPLAYVYTIAYNVLWILNGMRRKTGLTLRNTECGLKKLKLFGPMS